MNSINAADRTLLAFFNGSDSAYMDQLVLLLTNPFTWIPLYLFLFWMIVRTFDDTRHVWLIIGCVCFCMLLSSGVADGIAKPLIGRLRPSQDPALADTIRLVDGMRGSLYGFFSGHASNTMTVAVFFSLLLRRRWLTTLLVVWSLTNCWTRLYLGVHYPSDILCGILWGIISGTMGYQLYKYFAHKIFKH